MLQRKISITVIDSENKTLFSKDPAHPDHVPAVLALFAEVGNKITIDVSEMEIPSLNPSN